MTETQHSIGVPHKLGRRLRPSDAVRVTGVRSPAYTAWSTARRAVFASPRISLVALLVGLILIGVVVTRAVQDTRISVVRRTSTVAALLDKAALESVVLAASEDRFHGLTGTASYIMLKDQLNLFRQANPDCRAAYILGRSATGYVYLVDADDPQAAAYCSPGESFGNIPEGYVERLMRGDSIVAPPTLDEYGMWVTAVVPVYGKSGSPVAALGVDLAAGDWLLGLLPYILSTAGASVLLLGLLVSSIRAAQKGVEDELRLMATCDPLTGLPNRFAMDEYLCCLSADVQEPVTIAVLDVDNFKVINDSFTHSVGDRTLIKLTETIQSKLRENDFLSRMGADEFAIVFPNTSLAEALEIARDLREAVQETRIPAGKETLDITVSIGLAQMGYGRDAEAALSHADVALYAAKRTGRNKVVAYDRALPAEMNHVDVQRIVPLIKSAITDGHLVLHLQPIVESATGKVQCYEVLARIKDLDGSLIYPGAFLPIAEQFGLISELDRSIVKKTVSLLEERPDLTLFVNVSQTSASDRDFLEYIKRTLRTSWVDPSRLGFEITESAAASDSAAVSEWVLALKELGCPIALDDFGTGYSSFLRLGSLPVDFLKIDGAFVKDMDTDPTHRAFVQAMNEMAHAVGKRTVAEFVENDKIRAIIKELGVDYGQGYGLGKPAPAEHWDDISRLK